MLKSLQSSVSVIAACAWLTIAMIFGFFSATVLSAGSYMKCWEYPSGVAASGGIVVGSENVIFIADDLRLIGLDRSSGAVGWTSELGGTVNSTLATNENAVYLVTRVPASESSPAAGRLRSVSQLTGITNWIVNVPEADFNSVNSVGRVIVVAGTDGSVTGVDAADGVVKWRRKLKGGNVRHLVIDANAVTLQSGSTFETLSVDNGTTVRSVSAETLGGIVHFAGSGGMLILGDSRGRLRPGGSSAWEYKTGGSITHIADSGGNVLAASADNFIYSIDKGSGNVEWKRRMPGRISSLSLLGDDHVAITVVGEPTMYVVTLDDGRFDGQIRLAANEEFLGAPVSGSGSLLAVLTTNGVAAFGSDCRKGKSGEQGRRFYNSFVGDSQTP